ncbi:GPP34 family phosphoprotein [Streptomyces sp. NPDC047023]|uniref:GOLPH3/VPS74 family protein n=1 Tax=Streptomyces sp. NPDC047023 TaxID=3155139 RepID=UPI0033FE45C1
MKITLAEEITLLCLEDESGAARQRQSVGWAVAGGLLVELVLAERIAVSGKHLELTSTESTGDALLDARLAALETWLRGRRRRVTDWLTREHSRAVTATLESLTARGLVVEERHKVLGLFPVRRYPEADGTVERALRARLDSVVLGDAEPDERTAALVALIHSAKLHRLAFPGRRPAELRARTGEIAAGEWAADAVRAAIRDVQVAMLAATAASAAAVS